MFNPSYMSTFVSASCIRVKMTFPTFILDVNKFNSSLFTVAGTTITPLADSTVVQGTLNGYSHI